MPKYLSVTETAKLVRAALKKSFPKTKFSVRSDSYAGGASIRINWVDGPRVAEVDSIAQQYKGGDFDGMIDLKTNHSSWLSPDGSAMIAKDFGTAGSRGSRPGTENEQPHADAELVSFGADFIFCERKISLSLALEAQKLVVTYWGGVETVPELKETESFGWWFVNDSDAWKPVRADLDGNGCRGYYDWQSQIRRAAEKPETFARAN
jgi:hypothetical protein